ncbi:MAG: hypothetical protein ACLTKG_07865 [Collinsella intestinalis]
MEKLKSACFPGSGTNLQAIIDEIANGLPVEIVRVLCRAPMLAALSGRARPAFP